MTINDFIECFNETLKQDRIAKGIESLGHFVFYQYSNKKIGNYYEYKFRIEYVHTIGVINQFLSIDKTFQMSGSPEEKEKTLEETHKSILTSFLTKVLQPNVYNSLVESTYGTE